MASNLRVDNIQPTTGTGIGIGTANGSVTFNADVTGGMNITTGSLGVGIDNATATTTGFTRTIRVKGSSTSSGVSGLFAESYAGSAWFGFYSGSSTTDTPALLYPFNGALRIGTTNSVGTGGFAEKFRITNAGNIKFATSGTGIDFSATSDATGMTSELLDDYEEGVWTPDLRGGTTAGTTTYAHRFGSYTKIGTLVTLRGYINWTAVTGTGELRIYGIPFNNFVHQFNSIAAGPCMNQDITYPSGYTMASMYIPSGSEYLNVYFSGNNIGWNLMSIEGTGGIIFDISYRTA